MIALPPAPAPAPRRQVLVGTAIASAAAAAAVGGMLAVWLRLRDQAMHGIEGTWVPKDVHVPMVPANVLLISLLPICIFGQWAVYAAKRGDKAHTGLALGLVGLLGLAFINAQAYIWQQMGLPVAQGSFSIMFYAVTGTITALAIAGVVFSAVTLFRFLGGRTSDHESVAAHALYWYAFSAIFSVLWFVVYVTK